MFPCHFNINFSVCLTLTKHAELSLNTSGIFSHSAPPARLPHSLHPHAHHQRRSSLSGCLKQIAESKDLFLYAFFFFLQLHSMTFFLFFALPGRPTFSLNAIVPECTSCTCFASGAWHDRKHSHENAVTREMFFSSWACMETASFPLYSVFFFLILWTSQLCILMDFIISNTSGSNPSPPKHASRKVFLQDSGRLW